MNKTDNNTFVGYRSGNANDFGERNVFVGCQSGERNTKGSGNVIIGFQANLPDSLASNKLWVANSKTDEPLIQGDFKESFLKINGLLSANGGTKFIVPSFRPKSPKENEMVLWLANENGSAGLMYEATISGKSYTGTLVDFD
jgi:hypothetical protein